MYFRRAVGFLGTVLVLSVLPLGVAFAAGSHPVGLVGSGHLVDTDTALSFVLQCNTVAEGFLCTSGHFRGSYADPSAAVGATVEGDLQQTTINPELGVCVSGPLSYRSTVRYQNPGFVLKNRPTAPALLTGLHGGSGSGELSICGSRVSLGSNEGNLSIAASTGPFAGYHKSGATDGTLTLSQEGL